MIKLEEMEELEKEATPGPWLLKCGFDNEIIAPGPIAYYPDGKMTLISDTNYYPTAPHRIEDFRFIASSREFVPWAIAEIRKLMNVVEAAKEFHEMVGDGDNGPPQFYADSWEKLDKVLKDLERE